MENKILKVGDLFMADPAFSSSFDLFYICSFNKNYVKVRALNNKQFVSTTYNINFFERQTLYKKYERNIT